MQFPFCVLLHVSYLVRLHQQVRIYIFLVFTSYLFLFSSFTHYISVVIQYFWFYLIVLLLLFFLTCTNLLNLKIKDSRYFFQLLLLLFVYLFYFICYSCFPWYKCILFYFILFFILGSCPIWADAIHNPDHWLLWLIYSDSAIGLTNS